MHPGGIMEEQDVKITIDQNGNVHREIIIRPQPEVRKPQRLKRMVSSLTPRTPAEENG